MDELSYQLDVSDTFTYSDFEAASSDGDCSHVDKENFQEFQLELCHACAQSLPIELEDCLQRWRMLLLSSTCSLRKLRNLCSRLNKRLSQSHGTITEKNLHISQLEDAVKHLGAKVESTSEESERKSKDVAELHLKLNENYRLVAELSSDNLRFVVFLFLARCEAPAWSLQGVKNKKKGPKDF